MVIDPPAKSSESIKEACVEKADLTPKEKSKLSRQATYYFFFAVLMIGLNMLIQNLHLTYFVPFLASHFGQYTLIQTYYLSTSPYNMPELIGSVIAVGITYVVKFLLDKFIVFEKKDSSLKQTTREFVIYFGFAILTTLENIGIQFLLGLWTPIPLEFRIIIALTCGYITKFYLDRKYCFECND